MTFDSSNLVNGSSRAAAAATTTTTTTSANGHSDAAGVTTNGVNGHHHTTTINGHHKPKSVVEGFGTRAIHVGSDPSAETGAVIPAISLSTTYKQEGVGNHKGFEYSRSGNPNRNALEETLASIEAGGSEAIAFSSGSSTTATLIQSLGPNAHIISVNDVYGGTFRYMTRVAAENQGLETTFVDLEDLTEGGEAERKLLESLKSNTKLIWVESPTNPTLRVIDIKRLVEILDTRFPNTQQRPLLLVDNTFASPFYTSPLLLGADIVMHSITKYINGHSDVVMGALVLPPRHTEVTKNLRFLQNAIGAVPSAYDCWLAQRGAKTLHLRMREHGVNALKVARALKGNKWVEEVVYPGLGSGEKGKGKAQEIAWKNLSPHAKKWIESLPLDGSDGGFPFSGMVSFKIRKPDEYTTDEELAGLTSKFLSQLRLFTLAESLGGVESLAEVPARMTHASIPKEEREKLGISEGLVRLSVGVEDGDDLVRDLESGLREVFGRV